MAPEDGGVGDERPGPYQARVMEGWTHVVAGLKQVRRGACIMLTALAAEGARLAVERASAVLVLAGTRLAGRWLRRFRVPG